MNHRVVVTGMGLITSIGNDPTSVVASLKGLKHGFERVIFLNNPNLPVKLAGMVKDFDVAEVDYSHWTFPERYQIGREWLRSLAPHGVFAMASMMQAVEDSGLADAELSHDETGLFTASAGSPMLMHSFLRQMHATEGRRNMPMGVVSTVAGTLHFNLSAYYKIRGATCGFVSACASSSHAMAYAVEEIRLGRQKRMFVCGAEEVTADSILPFSGMRALSTNGDPCSASRPFDRGRDGFVATAGGVTLLLEDAESAVARGAKIYAEVKGWGQASDGFHIAISHPDGEGLRRAMNYSLKMANLEVGDIDYINAHATSTQPGDLAEGKAIQALFGKAGSRPPVSSTKALTGHGLSLAGVMEAAFSVLAINEGFIPGAAHLRDRDSAFDDLNLPSQTVEAPVRHVLTNSSGFGGGNVSIVLAKWD